MVFLAGIPQRVGYDTKDRGMFLTHKVQELEGQVHRSDYYLHVIESYGIRVKERTTSLNVSGPAQQEIIDLLKKYGIQDNDEVIVVNPGGNWDLKRWPKENFTQLLQHLISEKKAKVVVSGAKEDEGLIQEITSVLSEKPIVLTGQINLKQLIALMKRAQVVISADSGPLHLANSVGTKVIGIFGPTRPEITGPRGSGKAHILQHDVGCNREACYFLECPDNVCMKAVTVDNVLEIIR